MKQLLFFLSAFATSGVLAQNPTLEKLWETDTIFAIPESVLPQPENKILYISLIDGGGWNKDGVGGIGKLSEDGKQYDSAWITGLNAPKGLGIFENRLYAADISEVAVIDVKEGKVINRIVVEGASGLNDITVSDRGVVYVSDSRTGKIWRIENDKPTLYLDSMQGVNGLKAIGDDLYIGAGKNFLKADANKNITKIAETSQGIDGIEPTHNGGFLLSAWSGYIFYVNASGEVSTLLETHQNKMNTADIGYDQAKRLLYIPTFNAKNIVAYEVKF